MNPPQVAIYARVSSEQQAEAQTIASQVAALRERLAAEGLTVSEALQFLDEGYSGATLVRPALERLRDVVAAGSVDQLYVHSPDRLARKYAYQVLLVDEFRRAGVEVVFLNRALGQSPEDDLLLQVQGMIAEYERAKIIERHRRGKRHAARLELDEVIGGALEDWTTETAGAQGGWRTAAIVGVIALAGLAGIAVVWWLLIPAAPSISISRLAITVPSGFIMRIGQAPGLAISPDGRRIVFEAEQRLYTRSVDAFAVEPIAATEGGFLPFFSPDGAWLGWSNNSALMKMPAAGGPARKITDAFVGNGGIDWGSNNQIVFAASNGNAGLWTVSADGGTPQQVTTVRESAGETAHLWPDALPDGSVLYTVVGPSGHARDARLVVEDPVKGSRTTVAEGVTYGRYLAPGYLLSADATGTLLLQPFDLRARRTTGPPRAVVAGVRTGARGGAAAYAVSSSGTLAYVTGTELGSGQLIEMDLAGRERRTVGVPLSLENYIALSPNGRTFAATIRGASNDDIFLMDVESGRLDRFTFDAAEDETPVWSPDGTEIAYSSAWVGEQRRIFIKKVGSAEPARLVYTGKRHLHLDAWSPDGRWLAFTETQSQSVDLWVLNLDDTSRLLPVGTPRANVALGSFSPDGRWLAYDSDETGRNEVYVVSFPALGAEQMVSRGGGFYPRWSPSGQELFFFTGLYEGPGQMIAARRGKEAGFGWQAPVALFHVPNFFNYAVAANGRSLYLMKRNPDSAAREIFVVVNWLHEVSSRNDATAWHQ